MIVLASAAVTRSFRRSCCTFVIALSGLAAMSALAVLAEALPIRR
jgi:hypothetical protein